MTHSDKKRILVIEDDKHIAEGLKLNLALQGYEVAVALDGYAGINQWRQWQPDLIVLDIMLPGIDGLSILKKIRLEDEKLPILILSAKSALDDKVTGLAYGVDDYLSKPFDLEEFLLRVKRLIKQSSWYANKGEFDSEYADSHIFTFGGNSIDFKTATTQCKCGVVNLTQQEIKLLKIFIANQGKPISRNKLLKIGWGYAEGTTTRTVDNFMVRLRKYFEDNPRKPIFFKSRRSVGYIFNKEDDPSQKG